jgi:hypothetical protein
MVCARFLTETSDVISIFSKEDIQKHDIHLYLFFCIKHIIKKSTGTGSCRHEAAIDYYKAEEVLIAEIQVQIWAPILLHR